MIESIFRKMTQEEIDVEGIKDIKMVHVYDLTGAKGPEQKYGITAVLLNYGDNKQLNYTENDHCFNSFVNKIFEAYNSSENKEMIIMDGATRQILEAGEIPRHDTILDKYYNAEKLENPVLVNDASLSLRFEPFVEYLLSGLYKTMGTDVEVIDRKCGWRGAGSILFKVGKTNHRVVFKAFQVNETMISIKINGCLSANGDMIINLIFYNNEMSFSYRSISEAIEGSGSFTFNKESLREMQQIKKNGKQIFYDVNLYANPLNEDNAPMSEEASNDSFLNQQWLEVTGLKAHFPEAVPCAIYSLPFGMDYILYNENDINEQVDVRIYSCAYLWWDAAYADVRGWSVIKSQMTGLSLKNEEFRIINLSNKRGLVQNTFLSGTGSRYKQELEGKYVINGRKSE